jgi:hypothetical protein
MIRKVYSDLTKIEKGNRRGINEGKCGVIRDDVFYVGKSSKCVCGKDDRDRQWWTY